MTRSARQTTIVVCAVLLCAAEGLRRPRRPRIVRITGVPKGKDSVDVYRKAWEHKRAADEQFWNLSQTLPKNLLVLGVPTLPSDGPYRAVMRDTWMRHPLVCGIEMVPKPTCVIYAGFVFGNATSDPILRNGDLHFQMTGPNTPLGEGVLTLKMFLFYQYVSQTFSWATHIVRMDTDFYPHFHLMLPFIQDYHAKGNEMEYLGEPIPSHGCGGHMSDIQAGRDQKLDYCAQGALLIMSRPLAFAISNNFSEYFDPVCKANPSSYGTGGDDRMIGHVVTKFVRATRKIVTAVFGPRTIPGFDHADYRGFGRGRQA